jgi:DNA-directed RNA polymerase specialized sigma24 family protein
MEDIMANMVQKPDISRELLREAIMESLHSWPEVQRRIFIDIHYGGKSIAEVAGRMNVPQEEILSILDRCARKLQHALKAWRRPPQECRPLRSLPAPEYAARCCCR